MNIKLAKLKNKLLGIFTQDEIRWMFINRSDEDMFAEVGKASQPYIRINDKTRLPLIWHGYEILMNFNIENLSNGE